MAASRNVDELLKQIDRSDDSDSSDSFFPEDVSESEEVISDNSEEDDGDYTSERAVFDETYDRLTISTVENLEGTIVTAPAQSTLSLEVAGPSTVDETPRNSRKRSHNPSLWKRNLQKAKRTAGMSYSTPTGRIVAAKTVGPLCTCKMKCFDKIGQESEDIFSSFRKMSTKNEQDAYLFSLISYKESQRHRLRKTTGKKRAATFSYRVKTKGGDVAIRRKAFISVHGITEKAVKRLCEFMSTGHTSPPVDQRGKHRKQHTLPDNIIASVVSHIASFPAQESHYSRKDDHQRKYLSEKLNIKRMWYLYLEQSEPE